MENNLPKDSIQDLTLNFFKESLEIEKEFSEKFKEFVEQFPKFPIDEQYTWKDENDNNILK